MALHADPLPTPVAPAGLATDPHVRRLRRTAGLAGVLVLPAWVLQPVVVFGLTGGDEMLTWESYEAYPWMGGYELVTFGLIGVLLLVHVTAVRGLGSTAGTATRVGHALGVTGALCWLLQAGLALALYSTASSDLPGFAVDQQSTALATYGIVQVAALMTGTTCTGGWLLVLGSDGVRRGVVGRGLGVVLLVFAVTAVAPSFVPFGAPWGTFSVVCGAAVLGVALLVRSRR